MYLPLETIFMWSPRKWEFINSLFVGLCHLTHYCAIQALKKSSEGSLEEEMRSKRLIPPGTTILKEKPFVYVLSSKNRTEYCDACFKK